LSIHLVFITYNRLRYTKLALESVLRDPDESFKLTIWDNASQDGTPEYLRSISDPRIDDIVLSKENVGQVPAVNQVWGSSDCDLLGKLDNDCILTPGWSATLAQAHADIPDLGVVACWHYFLDDFDEVRAAPKIETFGGHRILRHPFTCGTGLLIKRSDYQHFGPLVSKATTQYWVQMALAGRINGYYYPLIHQEHMDDPKSEHSELKDEESYQAAKAVTFNINNHGQNTLADRWRWRQEVLDNILEGPMDPRAYVGMRRRLRKVNTWLRRKLV
jgi:GT2 family glycosyltransferase